MVRTKGIISTNSHGTPANRVNNLYGHYTSGAGVPEHRRILRAYLTSHGETRSGRDFERLFHDLLDTAGHAGPKRNSTEYQRGGKEWFYTNVDFLDQVARILNLEIVEIDSPNNEL